MEYSKVKKMADLRSFKMAHLFPSTRAQSLTVIIYCLFLSPHVLTSCGISALSRPQVRPAQGYLGLCSGRDCSFPAGGWHVIDKSKTPGKEIYR